MFVVQCFIFLGPLNMFHYEKIIFKMKKVSTKKIPTSEDVGIFNFLLI